MQVYFIDNEDYFHRKFIYTDADGNFFEDNDERAVFFARGVLETVKKLRWKPDIIHCSGWISHLLPLYLKKSYSEDPIFTESKLVLSLYNEITDQRFPADMESKILMRGVQKKDLDLLTPPNGINLAKLAVKYSDAVILGAPDIAPELNEYVETCSLPVLQYIDVDAPESDYIAQYNKFYDKIINGDAD